MENKKHSNINKEKQWILHSYTTWKNSKETKSKRTKIHNKCRFKHPKKHSSNKHIWNRLERESIKANKDKIYKWRIKQVSI